MRILIATDAFPPISGGSGWSTYELAKGLRTRGHEIRLLQPYSEGSTIPAGYDGFDVEGFPAFAPPVPFLRNYVRNERLYQRLSAHLTDVIKQEKIDLVHAQHVLTGPPSVMAAKRAGIPSVCTVRDYWPLCYWNDLLDNPELGSVCPGCSAAAMTRCLRPRAGAAWPMTLPAIPYMRANLKKKQRSLADADAVIAVSHQVSTYLRERLPAFARARIESIPNSVDVAGVWSSVADSAPPLHDPYAVFVGKLATNKGASSLVEVIQRAGLTMPLIVIGEGPDRAALERAARAAGRDVRILPWLNRQEVFRWLHHSTLLIFPSVWPEPLSRVLIEASALSVPIAAMNTGGTADIVVDEETGLLSLSVDELAADVARLATDGSLRKRLGEAARSRAQSHFDVSVVVAQMESLYEELVTSCRA